MDINSPDKKQIINRTLALQDAICSGLSTLSGDEFSAERWEFSPGEGYGITRVAAGNTIEKGAVNFSAIKGELNPKIASELKEPVGGEFFACGLSIIIHPSNPFVPVIHMNIRYFETASRWWVGGGIDLTPIYPEIDDVKTFHHQLKTTCDQFDPLFYAKYKKQCDEYFYLKHRSETRGVGGIFYDYLSENKDKNLEFNFAVGNAFLPCYLPLVKKYKDKKYSAENKEFQLYRRGRYVEFNLLFDRGTKFGIESGGRTESILLSMPPVVKWGYDLKSKAGTPEANLNKFLIAQDWI